MSIEDAKKHLKKYCLDDKITEFDVSLATAQLAADALNFAPKRISKTLTFKSGESTMVIATAGDAKIDNLKFKAKMLSPEQPLLFTGHAVGSVNSAIAMTITTLEVSYQCLTSFLLTYCDYLS